MPAPDHPHQAAAPAALRDVAAVPGPNRHYPGPAVVLRADGPAAHDGAAHGRWIGHVVWLARHLGWPDPLPHVMSPPSRDDPRRGLTETSPPGVTPLLAFAAPGPALAQACEIARWAWALASAERAPELEPGHADDPLRRYAAARQADHAGPASPPSLASAPPATPQTLLLAGSQGKTTVQRLLAAVAAEAGQRVALHECDRDALLLRGLEVTKAELVVVTQAAGELWPALGVHGAEDDAEAMLATAHAVADADQPGWLLLNGADEPLLRTAVQLPHAAAARWALFARDHEAPILNALRGQGGPTCGAHQGRLLLSKDGQTHDLGALATMPLALGGAAAVQVENLAAAALAAACSGWPLVALREVLQRFGRQAHDNPGRFECHGWRGATVVLDAARTTRSLLELMKFAAALAPRRVALLLGADGLDLLTARQRAQQLGAFRPDSVHLHDVAHAREPWPVGAVPSAVLAEGLQAAGLALAHIQRPAAGVAPHAGLRAAVDTLLADAREGDVLLLPLPDDAERERVATLLRAASR